MKANPLLLNLKIDLLANIIEYAGDIKKCAENITSQIREIIGTQVVGIFELNLNGDYNLISACPPRKEDIFRTALSKSLIAQAGHWGEAVLIVPGEGETGQILAELGMKESFFVPLRVGEESFGMLVLLDLMDNLGIQHILDALQDISGLLSLVLKNSFLYRNMETLVEQKTSKLMESESRSRVILQTAMDGFWLFNSRGRLLEVNDAYCEMVGYDRTELLTMTIQQLEAKESPREVESHIQKVLSGEECRFETKHFHKDGSYVNLEICTKVLSGGDGEMVAFLRDITERKRMEEDRKHLQTQLQQAQKMEAIGTLAGGIAHDFNNILGAILGYAEMAKDDCLSGSVNPQDLDQVIQAGHRAKDLIKQILAFSRQTKAQKIPLQAAKIVKDSIQLLRSSIPVTIVIQQDIDPETDLILADPTQFHQIVMNLCTNAYHAMEETGGTLTISLGNKFLTQQDMIGIAHAQTGHFVQLAISDNGSGIPLEIQEKMFDPYFTTKETGRGTGMGLAIVHGIVKSYDGFITCHSEVGMGTVFKINLPALSGQNLQETEKVEMPPVGTEHILLIDDEPMLVELGKTMLERLGYTVTARTNSFEALTTFKNQPETFDGVITDQTMPGMTGLDLARRMLQIRPDLPIILCTGYSSIISEEKAKTMGIKGFALKPIAMKDIAALIRKVLDEKI